MPTGFQHCPMFSHIIRNIWLVLGCACLSLKFMWWCILLMSIVSFQMDQFLLKWINSGKADHQIHYGSWQNLKAWFLLMKDIESLLQLRLQYFLSNCKSMSLGIVINGWIIHSPYASWQTTPNQRILLLPFLLK